jgi:hypothetical protein
MTLPATPPQTFAAPRAPQLRYRRHRVRRGAAPPAGPRREGPVGPRRLAAAPRPSKGPSCSLLVEWGLVEFGPSPARATMASADFSPSFGSRSRPPAPVARRNGEISRGKTLILHSIAAGFTVAVSAWLSGVPIPRRVTQPHRPRIRFLFVGTELCLKAPSPPHLAVTQLPSANGSSGNNRAAVWPKPQSQTRSSIGSRLGCSRTSP